MKLEEYPRMSQPAVLNAYVSPPKRPLWRRLLDWLWWRWK